MNNNHNPQGSNIPEASNTKPMDSKQDVAQSPDHKTDEDFPGYPHYPARESAMGQQTGMHQVDAAAEGAGTGANVSGVSERFAGGNQQQAGAAIPAGNSGAQDDLDLNEANTADGDSNVLSALDSREAERGTPQNVSNEDL